MRAVFIATLIAVAILGGVIFLTGSDGAGQGGPSTDNVSMADGKQIIEISAKGGYSPRLTDAKADTPTVLKVVTSNSFDCSLALVIPSLQYRKTLPISGTTEIEVPPQQAGTRLRGLCSMGMYSFAIDFQ